MRFLVYVPEVYIRAITVEATSAQEAKELVNDLIEQDQEVGHLEYHSTKDLDDWDAFEE